MSCNGDENPSKRIKTLNESKPRQGRPPKSWDEKGKRSRQIEAAAYCKMLQKSDSEKVLLAVIKMLKESADKDHKKLAAIIYRATESEEDLNDMYSKIKLVVPQITSLSPYDGLSTLLDANLSKRQYITVSRSAASCGKGIFPSYDRVRLAKKDLRPPEEFATISDHSASYPLDVLSNYTASRIVEMQKEVILQDQKRRGIRSEICEIIFSTGFDGSTGQSNYKQKYLNKSAGPNDDLSLFATTIIPLRLQSLNGAVYWTNRTPQSVRFVRPLKLEFVRETRAHTIAEKKALDDQITKMKTINVDVGEDHSVTLQFKFYVSIIDGKVLAAFTDTKSLQCCAICGSSPNDFNLKANVGTEKFTPKEGSLQYGVSPLHSYIRGFEWLLHISYRLEIKTWQARSDAAKASVKARKKSIQAKLWDQMQLRVDIPNSSGSGTSNDGNCARRAFKDYKLFAEILELDVEVVYMYRIILIALNCQMPVNVEKFNSYCMKLFDMYLLKYNWFKLPSSIHKILIHGAEIIRESALPVGMLGEEGAEARNKLYKSDRLYHARKSSRYNNMYDVFFRGIDSSDPIMSSCSLTSRINAKGVREALPEDVIKLLEIPYIQPNDVDCVNLNEYDMEIEAALDGVVLENENDELDK